MTTLVFPPGILDTKITVDADSAGAPWEFIWGSSWSLDKNPYFVGRVTREHQPSPLPPWRRPVELLTWGDSRRRFWPQDWDQNYVSRPVLLQSTISEEPAGQRAGILQIIGAPLDSGSAGLVVAISDSAQGSYSVRPEEIKSRFGTLRLCILQSPTAETRTRFASDRTDAAIAKRIGAEIFRSGIPIVIVIPVLPEEAAADLLEGIQKVLIQAPRNAVPYLKRAIHSFRVSFWKKQETEMEKEDALEMGSDICIYARDRVSFELET